MKCRLKYNCQIILDFEENQWNESGRFAFWWVYINVSCFIIISQVHNLQKLKKYIT